MKKLMCLLLVLVMVCGMLTACGGSSDEAKASEPAASAEADAPKADKPAEVKLAMVGPLTGDSAQYGLQFQRGVDEAVAEYNAKGGTQVSVDYFDDKNDAKEAVSIGNKIIADGGYMAVIGPFSSTCALAMAEVLDEEKIITISPSCSHPDYVTLYDYTFRLSHVNSYEGKVAADYCKDEFGAKKVAAIYSNNDWGIAVDDAFVENIKANGMEMVANESFIVGQTKDFSASLTKIMQSGADALYYMGQYTECGLLLKQIKDLGLDIDVIVTTSSYKAETLQLAGDAAEDVVFMTAFINDGTKPELNDFEEMVREKYDVAIDNFIMRAYDAVRWLMDAFDRCESTDPDTLREAIIEVGKEGIDGINGYFVLGDDRNVEREFFFTRWNGKSGDEAAFEKID